MSDNKIDELMALARRILAEIDLVDAMNRDAAGSGVTWTGIAPRPLRCACPGDPSASAAGWSPYCFEHGTGPYTIDALPVFRSPKPLRGQAKQD